MALTEKGYLPRLTDAELDLKLNAFGAVCIEGPKWCGKTWSALNKASSASFLGDPANNFEQKRRAEISPDLVLSGDSPHLIDEWQEVPPIWDAVRHFSDRTKRRGLFLLTGSSTPHTHGIEHSGAGRIARMKMHPMSLYESGGSNGKVSLQSLFSEPLSPVDTGDIELKTLIEYVVRGGWPGSLGLPLEAARQIPKEYLKAVAESDMHRIDGVSRDINKIRLLLRSLGRNECTIAGVKTLAKDIREQDEEGINPETISNYLNVLDRLFLLENQPAFNPNLRSSVRVGKSAKRHFSDPSLAVAALGATPTQLFNDLNTFGFLFEALCERDLRIYAQAIGGRLFHYRDGNSKEIDAIVEVADGTWGAFEIKLGANQIDSAAEGLLAIKNMMESDPHARPPKFLCVICGLTSFAYTRPDGVLVLPITALRP